MAKAKKKPKPAVVKRRSIETVVDVERVAAVLAAPEYSTRAVQAKALGVSDRTLQRWLLARPEILPRALELAREASAATMITGYRRLGGIVAKGNAQNCIKAMKLLAQLRGDLVEKRELSGAVTLNDPRLAGFTDEQLRNAIGALAALGSRGAGEGGGGRAPRKDG